MRIRLPRLSLPADVRRGEPAVIMTMGATLGTLLHRRIEAPRPPGHQRLAVTIAHVGIAGQLRDGEPDSGPLSREADRRARRVVRLERAAARKAL
jgi:hypothetical protein